MDLYLPDAFHELRQSHELCTDAQGSPSRWHRCDAPAACAADARAPAEEADPSWQAI